MSIARIMQQAAAGNSAGPEGAWDLSYAYWDDSIPPYDVSTAAYTGLAELVTAYASVPAGIFLSPDRTKVYICDDGANAIDEFTNTTSPSDIRFCTYIQQFSLSGIENVPEDIYFKSDGTKFYVIGSSGDAVHEFNLSTAWDISTSSLVQSFSVASEDTSPTGLFFKPDGTKMYVTGDAGNDVNEYDLSTAWDVSTASYLQNFSVSSQDLTPESLSFSPDGTKMYVLGGSGDDINEYTLSTAWDVSTATYVQNFSVSSQETTPLGVYFDFPNSSWYVVGSTSDTIYQYHIRGGFSVASQDADPQGLFFKPDGTKMYVIGTAGDSVYEYDLSTAWDTSTASYLQTFSVSAQETTPQGIFFKPDGTKMYVTGGSGDDVNEYSLSTAWDISTASYTQNFSVSAQSADPTGLSFKSDGTAMYILGFKNRQVYQYALSTAWDVSTASYDQLFDVSAQESAPEDLFFKPDGTKLYIVGSTADSVNEYALSTPWDISSASHVQNFSVRYQDTFPTGIFFKDDGTQMFVLGIAGKRVFTYTLGVQP